MVVKSKKDELKEVLERLNNGEPTARVKQEARQLLAEIDPKELSKAEQQLINEGLPETELRHLCAAHIEAMADELEALKTEIPEGHPLHTLITEHDHILAVLDRLEGTYAEIKQLDRYDPDNPVYARLRNIGKNLLETEKHHAKEEDALFPAVDRTGVTGPTRIMRMEHEDLWPHKERIDYLAKNVADLDFAGFKEELEESAEYLILTLRDHIYKENNILYPTAKQMLDEDAWQQIKEKSEEIGRCHFTESE